MTETEASIFFGRRPVNPRIAWDPAFRELTPDQDARSNIYHDCSPSHEQRAVLLSLDARRGRQAVITSRGWHLRTSEGEFRGNEIQRAMPDPLRANDPDSGLEWLRGLLRLNEARHNAGWERLLTWMVHAMQPVERPGFLFYPILVIAGPPNTGKTVAAKLLAEILDPTNEPLHDLHLADTQRLAVSHHLLAFDGTGKISRGFARDLLNVSTALGRQALVRPILITTGDRLDAAELGTRASYLELPVVEKPLSQEEIWRQFAGLRPTILGGFLTLLSRRFSAAI